MASSGVRRVSIPIALTTFSGISHEADNRFFLHYADLTDGSSLSSLLHNLEPDEIYNLGAQSHVKVSFEIPEFTADVVACGTLRLARSHAANWRQVPFLSGFIERNVRKRGASSERGDGLSSAQSLRLRQGLRAQHYRELSRELWNSRVERYSLQP